MLALSATLAFFFLGRCAQPGAPPAPNPQTVARTYLVALKAGDYETCYRMLAERDLVYGSLDSFLGQIPMAPNVERRWFGQIEAATEYRLGTASERSAEATVPVDVTTPNLVLWERMLGASDHTRQAVQAKAEKQLAGGDYPRLSYPDQIVMVREGDEWRLLAGFAQRARINRLHEQALAAYHQLQFDKALGLYREMLERLGRARFSSSGELACRLSREMKRVEQASTSAAAAQSYLPRLLLRNVDAKPTLSGNPGMFGQIVNSGDRPLDEVELTVSYYSGAGKLVYGETHTPLALPLEFTDFDLPIVPLRAGETRDFGITLKASSEIQEQNKARMTVTGIIFSEPIAAPPKLAAIRTYGSEARPAQTPAR
jgi:hypothetical protein